MKRRICFAAFLLLLTATSAWPKFKDDEQKYLDDQFKAVLDQMQAMGNQIAALNAQLAELKQNQAQVQTVITRQQHQLQDLDEMLQSLHISNEENFSKIKTSMAELRTESNNALTKLSGQQAAAVAAAPAEVPPVAPPVAATPARAPSQGYITAVDGSTLMIDMGSAQGIQLGSRLTIYKATDPNTRVGVIEVTQVVDASNARARIVTMNSGVKPEFSDVVRVE